MVNVNRDFCGNEKTNYEEKEHTEYIINSEVKGNHTSNDDNNESESKNRKGSVVHVKRYICGK